MPVTPPIIVDVSRLIWRRWTGRQPTGIDRVCLAYARHYGDAGRAFIQRGNFRRILSPRHSRALFALLERRHADFKPRLALLLARAIPLADKWAEPGALYLNVGHTGLDEPGLQDWLAGQKIRPVYLIHDLIPITHPEFCRAGEVERHEARMTTALDTAAGLVANSRATRDSIAAFAAARGLPMPPTLVAWLGCDFPARPRQPRLRKRPYFLVVGTIEGRKNHALLLELWRRMVAEDGDGAPDLIVVGQRGWQADAVFAALDHDPALKDHVHELANCDDAELGRLIDGAVALLMPSHVEGFGIPVLEALDRGTPVIAADLAVYRELVGDLAHYRDASDIDGWRHAIDTALADTAPRPHPALRGFRVPTWAEHFAKVDHWLARL